MSESLSSPKKDAAVVAEKSRMSTYSKMMIFGAYAFLRSTKPSSSYMHQFVDAADDNDNGAEYQKIYPKFLSEIQPWSQRAQLLFYTIVVLFSSQIGYDKIIHMDYFFQLLNLVLTASLYFKRFRVVETLKVANFIYGITTATSNIVHSYAYLVFEKHMFQKMTSISRGLTMAGHMIGSVAGNVVVSLLFNPPNIMRKFLENYVDKLKVDEKTVFPKYLTEIFPDAIKSLGVTKLNCFALTFVISIVAVVISAIVAWFFPKPEKEVQKKSNIKELFNAAKQLRKRRVMFWALAWSTSFMIMLYSKSWSSNLWKHHQQRLHQRAENGIYDAIAYGCGFAGSFLPAYVVRLGAQAAVIIQLFVIALSVLICFLQEVEFRGMRPYYLLHAAFMLVLYYSLSFQNSELAKSIDHSQLKMVFNVLSALVFVAQNVLNIFIDGMFRVAPLDISTRYIIMAIALGFSFLIVFVGFAGNAHNLDDDREVTELDHKKEAEIKVIEETSKVSKD